MVFWAKKRGKRSDVGEKAPDKNEVKPMTEYEDGNYNENSGDAVSLNSKKYDATPYYDRTETYEGTENGEEAEAYEGTENGEETYEGTENGEEAYENTENGEEAYEGTENGEE
ncbi:uncharacterized protein TM35_003041000, partial [Trypanosoma theileri]